MGLERLTRSEQIRLDLTNQILGGQRLPGSALDEQELAASYGVSRTPVREALRLLAASGLVAHRPNHGAEVAAPSAADLRDMFQVMADLEGLCAGYAARAMPPEGRRQLADLHESMASIVRAGDGTAYSAANESLHGLIYSGSQNSYLVEITMQTRQRLRPYRRAQFSTLGRLAASHAEHDAIVLAILRGDRAAAQRAMSEHIHVVRDAFLRLAQGEEAEAAE
jgi:DNA-binding GntR family transcriptional regulator